MLQYQATKLQLQNYYLTLVFLLAKGTGTATDLLSIVQNYCLLKKLSLTHINITTLIQQESDPFLKNTFKLFLNIYFSENHKNIYIDFLSQLFNNEQTMDSKVRFVCKNAFFIKSQFSPEIWNAAQQSLNNAFAIFCKIRVG